MEQDKADYGANWPAWQARLDNSNECGKLSATMATMNLIRVLYYEYYYAAGSERGRIITPRH